MKKIGGIFLFLIFISSVSAVIFIEDNFENRYNVGEAVVLEFKVSSDDSVSDFVESYLKCDGDKLLVDKRYVFLNSESKNFEVEFPLRSEGDCQFEVFFRNDKAVSQEFRISPDIEIIYFLNYKYFFPSEKIIVSGNLTKFNGADFSGVIDFKLGAFVEKSYNAKNGTFSFEYQLSPEIVPGEYSFILEVSEGDSFGDVLNYGKITDEIFVKSKATSIEIIAPESVKPASNESFKVRLLDQAGKLMKNESVIFKLVDSNSDIILNREVESDSEVEYNFSSSFPRGSAYLNAYYGGVSSILPIQILDNKEISVSFFDNSIRFTNVGNVIYDGTVSYNLEDGEEVVEKSINISLDVGKTHIEELFDYSGDYNISSGNFFSSVSLTGAAVLVGEGGEIRFFGVFVIFIFTIMLLLGFYFVRNKIKNGYFFSKKAEHEYRKYGNRSSANEDDSVEKSPDVEKENAKKLLVASNSEEPGVPKVKAFMIFLKVNSEISEYESLFRNYGFRLNKVDSLLGYSLFYEGDEKSLETKIFNFARSIKRFADSRGDYVTIVLNRGFFEKKVSILKKFALFNREILNMFPGKFVVSQKIMDLITVKVGKTETAVDVMDRKIRLSIIN